MFHDKLIILNQILTISIKNVIERVGWSGSELLPPESFSDDLRVGEDDEQLVAEVKPVNGAEFL